MSRHKSAFLRRNAADTFNQANDLVSHGLIFNRRQRSTNAQIEPVGHHFLHLNSGLADMAFVLKVADAFIEGVCNNGQADGADLVDPCSYFCTSQRTCKLLADSSCGSLQR